MDSAIKEKAQKIKLVVFDVDGVMTDGGLTLGDDGQEYKTFNTQDGLGMKLLSDSGVALAIITGLTSEVVKNRAENTGVQYIYQGIHNKLEAFNDLIEKCNLAPEQVAFMGDDVVDVPPMKRCGFGISVPAAPDNVKAIADYVTNKSGGKGAVRELCELMMHAQGTYEAQMAQFFD